MHRHSGTFAWAGLVVGLGVLACVAVAWGQTAPQVGAEQTAGMDLSLSRPGTTLQRAIPSDAIGIPAAFLEVFPFGFLLFMIGTCWSGMGVFHEARTERLITKVRRAVARASTSTGSRSPRQIRRQLSRLARFKNIPRTEYGHILQQVETEILSKEVSARVESMAESWRERGKPASPPQPFKHAPLVMWIGMCGVVSLLSLIILSGDVPREDNVDAKTAVTESARVSEKMSEKLLAGRTAYDEALVEPDAARRSDAFGRAAALFFEVISEYWYRPGLVTDWGNAALGAGDLGAAMLAYRNALYMAPTFSRAERNLSVARNQMPVWAPRKPPPTTSESLFYWQTRWPRTQRIGFGSVALAIASCLFMPPFLPIRRKWTKWLARLGWIPFVAAVVMISSSILADDQGYDGVIVTLPENAEQKSIRDKREVVLRARPSEDAPPVTERALPAGSECQIIEWQKDWMRISLGMSRVQGWVKRDEVRWVSGIFPSDD